MVCNNDTQVRAANKNFASNVLYFIRLYVNKFLNVKQTESKAYILYRRFWCLELLVAKREHSSDTKAYVYPILLVKLALHLQFTYIF